MTLKNSTPIIILGMHRSGTSCLAGSLQQAGVYLGEVSTSNKYNKKGNRENLSIMQLNESILTYNNSSWDKPPTKKLNFNKEHLRQGIEIITTLQEDSKTGIWGFKDPRFLITHSFWMKLLPEPLFIGSIRNPIDVAYSINRRDKNFSLEKALQLWLDYNQSLLLFLKKEPFPLISFNYSNRKYQNKVKQLITDLFGHQKRLQNDFFDDRLRSQSTVPLQMNDKIQKTYAELQTFLT